MENIEKLNDIFNLTLSPDVILQHIGPYMGYQGQLRLSLVSKFFNHSKDLTHWIKDARTQNIQIVTYGNSTFLLFGETLFSYGDNEYGVLAQANPDHQSFPQLVKLPCKKVVTYDSRTFIISSDGSLYGCGDNSCGQLGLGDISVRYALELINIPENNKIKQVIPSYTFTLLIGEDGSLYSFGMNDFGQLGFEKSENLTPQRIEINEVRQAAVGDIHAIVLCDNGLVYTFGCNKNGQLGLNHFENQFKPQLITHPESKKACQVFANSNHGFILYEDGSICGFGNNHRGQLGIGNIVKQPTPQFINFPEGKKLKQLLLSVNHTVALFTDGTVFGFGGNSLGQLGLGHFAEVPIPQPIQIPGNKKILKVAVSDYHTLLLCEDGSVFGMGDNTSKQLGEKDSPVAINTPQSIPLNGKIACNIVATLNNSFVQCTDGTIYIFGQNSPNQIFTYNFNGVQVNLLSFNQALLQSEDSDQLLKKLLNQ